MQEKEEELEEGDKLLQSKLEELAVLEQQLEQLEEVMRQPPSDWGLSLPGSQSVQEPHSVLPMLHVSRVRWILNKV